MRHWLCQSGKVQSTSTDDETCKNGNRLVQYYELTTLSESWMVSNRILFCCLQWKTLLSIINSLKKELGNMQIYLAAYTLWTEAFFVSAFLSSSLFVFNTFSITKDSTRFRSLLWRLHLLSDSIITQRHFQKFTLGFFFSTLSISMWTSSVTSLWVYPLSI